MKEEVSRDCKHIYARTECLAYFESALVRMGIKLFFCLLANHMLVPLNEDVLYLTQHCIEVGIPK